MEGMEGMDIVSMVAAAVMDMPSTDTRSMAMVRRAMATGTTTVTMVMVAMAMQGTRVTRAAMEMWRRATATALHLPRVQESRSPQEVF